MITKLKILHCVLFHQQHSLHNFPMIVVVKFIILVSVEIIYVEWLLQAHNDVDVDIIVHR